MAPNCTVLLLCHLSGIVIIVALVLLIRLQSMLSKVSGKIKSSSIKVLKKIWLINIHCKDFTNFVADSSSLCGLFHYVVWILILNGSDQLILISWYTLCSDEKVHPLGSD